MALREEISAYTEEWCSLKCCHRLVVLLPLACTLYPQVRQSGLLCSLVIIFPSSVALNSKFLPDAALCLPDAALCLPDAALCLPDATLCLPDAALCLPDAAFCLPDAALCLPDAALCLPDAALCLFLFNNARTRNLYYGRCFLSLGTVSACRGWSIT